MQMPWLGKGGKAAHSLKCKQCIIKFGQYFFYTLHCTWLYKTAIIVSQLGLDVGSNFNIHIWACSNFHFSHYKYMETLSCHSNENTLATTIKSIIYVEVNVMKIYAKFQLHPPYSFWEEDFLFFFKNLAFWLPWQPIKISDLDKIHLAGKGLLQKYFCKTFF